VKERSPKRPIAVDLLIAIGLFLLVGVVLSVAL